MTKMFADKGVHIIADGQFGSTGKGALAAFLAHIAHMDSRRFAGVITSAGPNSGHTSYYRGEKIVLKQLPTFAVVSHLMGITIPVYFSAGAIIDIDILASEMKRYPGIPVKIHGCAAIVTSEDREAEHSGTVAAVAGTRSGTGAALSRKVLRDPEAVAKWHIAEDNLRWYEGDLRPESEAYIMEVSQGYSLGLNSQEFYPKVTSRECTFMQAMADARISPRWYARGYLSFRTFPIRVGNVDGHSSGHWYADQNELTWEDLGQEPELTTVTQRVRRIATFSQEQFLQAMLANTPDYVFMNFMNYLKDPDDAAVFEHNLRVSARRFRERTGLTFEILEGHGPRIRDVRIGFDPFDPAAV